MHHRLSLISPPDGGVAMGAEDEIVAPLGVSDSSGIAAEEACSRARASEMML
jgi:uncharacterized protein GlcG (DUF336 family)